MINLERRKFSLKKDDQVQVIAGREKGKIGKVLKVDSRTGKVTVEKMNMVKRHTRPTQQNSGGILEKELPLDFSNVLLLCSKCNRGVRHGNRWLEKGSKSAAGSAARKVKVRFCKRCDETIDTA